MKVYNYSVEQYKKRQTDEAIAVTAMHAISNLESQVLKRKMSLKIAKKKAYQVVQLKKLLLKEGLYAPNLRYYSLLNLSLLPQSYKETDQLCIKHYCPSSFLKEK